MATIYNPWQDPEHSPLAGEFLTPALLNGTVPDGEVEHSDEDSGAPEMEDSMSETSPHGDMMKQALDTIMQQSTLIGQLTAQLAAVKK
jgi:hypothetical protein